MQLIVDANVVIASLIGKGTVFLLLKQLNRAGVRLISPSFLKEEIDEHFDEIVERSGLDSITLKYLFSEILNLIEIVPKSKYEMFMTEAERICSDKDDLPYLALSLSFGKVPIWSFDRELEHDCKRVEIKVVRELEEVIEEILLRKDKG